MSNLDFKRCNRARLSKSPLRGLWGASGVAISCGAVFYAASVLYEATEDHFIAKALQTHQENPAARMFLSLYGDNLPAGDGTNMEKAYRRGFWTLAEQAQNDPDAQTEHKARLERFLTIAIERGLHEDVKILLQQIEPDSIASHHLYLALYQNPSENIARTLLNHGIAFDHDKTSHSNQMREALWLGWHDFAQDYAALYKDHFDRNSLSLRYALEATGIRELKQIAGHFTAAPPYNDMTIVPIRPR